MRTINWFTRASAALCGLCIAMGVVLGLPTAELSNTPSGTVTGGAGSLIPNVNNTAVSNARVDDGGNPGLDVTIFYNTQDLAAAEDGATMVGDSTAPASDEAVIWKVIFSGSGNTNGYTVNAPGNTASGSYKVYGEANVYTSLSASGHTTQSGSDPASVSIQNDTSGSLSDPSSLTFGTLATPKSMAGTWAEDFTVTFSYGVWASMELKAKRQEVGVGGKSSAGNVTGSITAWGIRDGFAASILKKTDDPTVDAVWVIQ
jgi:hypothetical protein